MTFLSDTHLSHLGSRFARMSGLKGGGERAFGEVLKTVETVGVAGAMSFVNARYAEAGKPAYEVAGVPADLAGGILIGALSLAGYLGKYDEHGHNISNGLIATYAVRMGSIWGANARVQHATGTRALPTQPAPHAAAGLFGTGAPTLYPTVEAAAYDWAA